MKTHYTHNDFHLGDNLIHLNFLRRLALANPTHRFVHALHECHIEPCRDVVLDANGDPLPNLELIPLAAQAKDSIDCWKNAGATKVVAGCETPVSYVPGFWEQHPKRGDWCGFHLDWFAHLAGRMGLAPVLTHVNDLLFDYPKLLKFTPHFNPQAQPYDVLVVNSQPCSGQFRAFDRLTYLDELIAELAVRWRVITTAKVNVPGVACTRNWNLSVTQIGNLSLHVPYLVMISTGPSWPTFNVYNRDSVQLRLLFLDAGEKLTLGDAVQVQTSEQGRKVLQQRGIL